LQENKIVMDWQKYIQDNLTESAEVKKKTIVFCTQEIVSAASLLYEAFMQDGKILLAGNGGSAADAQHLAAELVVRLSHDIKRPGLPAMALSANTSVLTAGGNDIGFENVFARQVEAFASKNDILVVLSTSGNSLNIVRALEQAVKKRIKSIGLLGESGGLCKSLVTVPILVPSENVQRIQETHMTIGHIILELVETKLFKNIDHEFRV
jgi:D-sedoheptulose 7-phosphate isomerase